MMDPPSEGPLPSELEERRQAALTLADRATELLAGLQEQLNHLRRRTWLNLTLVTLDIALSIGLGFALVQSNHATKTARAEVIARCQTNNIQRWNESKLWGFIIMELRAGNTTSPAVIAQLQSRVDHTFAPSDCQHTDAATP